MNELSEEKIQIGFNEDGSFTLDKDDQDIYTKNSDNNETI